MTGRAARTVAWIGGLLAAVVALRLAGTGEVAAPPLTSLDGLGEWADERGPTASAMGLVRFGAELAAWYLLALTLLHVAARALRSSAAGVLADALSLPGASRLVRAGVGLGLVASTAVASDREAGPPGVSGTAVMEPADAEPGTATMVPRPAADPPPAPAPSPVPDHHRVERGDSFWTIAADVLEQAWKRPVTDTEIDPFWRTLVEVNRHRLVSDDPDLVLPGQVFEVPAVPPRPAGA